MKHTLFTLTALLPALMLGGCGSSPEAGIAKLAKTIDISLVPAEGRSGVESYRYYVNPEGETVHEYQGNTEFGEGAYLKLGLLHDGLALVKGKGAFFIDKEGNVVIDCREMYGDFEKVKHFSEGIAFIQGKNSFTAINTKGEELFEVDGYVVSPMLGGYAVYSTCDRHGEEEECLNVINRKGEVVFESSKDEHLMRIGGNFAGVWGLRSMAHPSQFPVLDGDDNLLYILDLDNGKHYLENCDVEIPSGYLKGFDWNNCLVYDVDEKYGLIDSEGKILIEPEYEYMDYDGEWYVFVEDDKVGWCDKNGKVMIEPQFEYGDRYSARFGIDKWAYLHNENCFIDRKGEVVLELEPGLEALTNFIGDRCLTDKGWINREGEIVGDRFYIKSSDAMGELSWTSREMIFNYYTD